MESRLGVCKLSGPRPQPANFLMLPQQLGARKAKAATLKYVKGYPIVEDAVVRCNCSRSKVHAPLVPSASCTLL